MSVKQYLYDSFTNLETNTVSNSFGGRPIPGRAPDFRFAPFMDAVANSLELCEEPLQSSLKKLKGHLPSKAFKYTMLCLGRFAFCIELTNLRITSTKMKTRWVTGKIIKTMPGSFANYQGDFSPGEDERSASFDDCYSIFCRCAYLLSESPEHLTMMTLLSERSRNGTPYESVFTYEDRSAIAVHTPNNIRLTHLEDIGWLVQARPIIRPTLSYNINNERSKLIEKISTKCYKTDRSQTGEVQTNRAKRWECLSIDFQYASIEQCWSVEKKLLSDVAHFEGYPEESKQVLRESNLFYSQDTTVCPITFKPLVFSALLGGGGHGESKFQVGHMTPLKNGGFHQGDNIEWISNDGNRIQGSLGVEETREMLVGIFIRMRQRGLIF